MPIVTVDVPGRDEVEAKALIYEALKAYIEARLSTAAFPLHSRSYREGIKAKVARAAAAAQSLYPGDTEVALNLHETMQPFQGPAAVLPIADLALPAERPPAPSRSRPGASARPSRREGAS